MTIWVDARLSPAIAEWIQFEVGFDSVAVRELGLRDAEDLYIFEAARSADVTVQISSIFSTDSGRRPMLYGSLSELHPTKS